MAEHDTAPLRAKILTVSDGVADGTREDTGGPALAERLEAEGYEIIERRTVRDGSESVLEGLMYVCKNFEGLVVTTGGTGFGIRDFTPEGTKRATESVTQLTQVADELKT